MPMVKPITWPGLQPSFPTRPDLPQRQMYLETAITCEDLFLAGSWLDVCFNTFFKLQIYFSYLTLQKKFDATKLVKHFATARQSLNGLE